MKIITIMLFQDYMTYLYRTVQTVHSTKFNLSRVHDSVTFKDCLRNKEEEKTLKFQMRAKGAKVEWRDRE